MKKVPLVLSKYLSEHMGVSATCSSYHVDLILLRSFLQGLLSSKSFCKQLLLLNLLPKAVRLLPLTINWISLGNYSRSIGYF